MAIDEETKSKIRRMYAVDHYRVHAISQVTGVHHHTIKGILGLLNRPKGAGASRTSKLDPFVDLIESHMREYSSIRAPRLHQILSDRGYQGSVSLLRRRMQKLRRRIKKPYMRMMVRPGEQAQVDWAHCGEIKVGRAVRKLYMFVMVLSYSRAIYARFCLNQHTSTFLRCHELAFEYFSGVPRIILYDNLKSAVIARRGNGIRLNEDLLNFSGFYCFEPRPCHPFRGNEKGRVERSIRFLRENYLAARRVADLKTGNESLQNWCDRVGNKRPWPDDRRLRVEQMLQAERTKLIRLTDRRLLPTEQRSVHAGKQPWIHFDLNYYSIPAEYVGSSLVLSAGLSDVKVYSEESLIAEHERSFDRGLYVEQPGHRETLIKHRHFGRGNMFRSALSKEFPDVDPLIDELFNRGEDQGSIVRRLYLLLEQFGSVIFKKSLAVVVNSEHMSLEGLLIQAQKLQKISGLPPPLPVQLPDNPKIRELQIKSHELQNYDNL